MNVSRALAVATISILALPASRGANADPSSTCALDLTHASETWGACERRYVELRREIDVLEAGTPANREVNDLLGRGFEATLRALDRYFAVLDRSALSIAAESLERDFEHSGPIPYRHRIRFPSIAEMRTLVDEINSGRRFEEENRYIFTRPEGGTLVDETPFVDQYLRYRRGLDDDPFVIEDRVWMELLSADPVKFRSAFAKYRRLRSRREEIAREFEPYAARLDRLGPRVRESLEYLDRLTRLQKRTSFATQIEEFDLSAVSPTRRLVDGHFFAMPLPIGAYGERINRRLRRTVQVMTLSLAREALERLRDLERSAPELIGRETTRGRAARTEHLSEDLDEKDPLLGALVEGYYTIAQTLNFLLSARVDGESDGFALAEKLLRPEGGAPSAVALMTLYLRIATLGPATLAGSRFPRPLERDVAGRVGLSHDLKADLGDRLARDFDKARTTRTGRWFDYRKGIACPVARDRGIQIAADSFGRVFAALAD